MTDTLPPDAPLSIGLLLFPQLTQLDLTGPYEVFARVPGAKVHLIWKSLDPVPSDRGLQIVPTATLVACPPLDVLCVPGGAGQMALMDDAEVLGFIREQSTRVRYLTAVCTGSLVLGAVGLLKGRRATCHWMSHDQLSLLGAIPVDARIVEDGNVITGGGVTAGIDFALGLVARLKGELVAKMVQLGIEYDPAPPFDAGSPKSAGTDLAGKVLEYNAKFLAKRREITERTAATLRLKS